MAGFIDRDDDQVYRRNPVSRALQKLANLGMDYDDMIIKQSKAVGATEAEMGNQGFMPKDFLYSLALADIGQKKFIGYFDRQLEQRRNYLREFAMNGEIEFIIETIADEAIVYDDRNYFCKPSVGNLRRILKEDVEEEVVKYTRDTFNKIYYAHRFVEGQDAWSYFKQFLIDGFLAFEIIWDEGSKNVIGFKELDALSLRPGIIKDQKTGKLQKIWVQYEDIPAMKRELYDSQVIYISYAKANFTTRTSYVERLIRSFNLLRILENSRIIWNIMNSSFRMKMVVPIGTKSPQKAKESLAEMMSIYKEDIQLDNNSGELTVNGRPSLQFYKNYLFPSKGGEEPEIEAIGGDGPDLSEIEVLRYFFDKLIQDSKVPFERFDREGGGGSWEMDASGMSRDEIRFSKFITRLRSIFQEIMVKPLILQICIKYPELKDDSLFKSSIGIEYEEENMFKEAKEMEIMEKRVDFVTNMLGLEVPERDEEGMIDNVPFFDALFLSEKYLKMAPSDLETNQKYINRRKQGLDPSTGKPLKKKADDAEAEDIKPDDEKPDDIDLDF